MASNYQVVGTDLDSKLKAISGGYSARANVGYSVAGTDIANRYAPTSIVQDRGPTTNFKTAGTDIGPLFRDFRCPDVILTGPTSVPAGGGGGDGWGFTGSSVSLITGYRFQVEGHGGGAWTLISQYEYGGYLAWQNPFGSPSIGGSPGGPYTFYWEVGNADGFVARKEMLVTVT